MLHILFEQYVNLKHLLSASLDLAEAGGQAVVDVKKETKLNTEVKGKTQEGAKELKTNGDMRSHRQIMAGFHRAFPELESRVTQNLTQYTVGNTNTRVCSGISNCHRF